jgi:hypothetical protein
MRIALRFGDVRVDHAVIEVDHVVEDLVEHGMGADERGRRW